MPRGVRLVKFFVFAFPVPKIEFLSSLPKSGERCRATAVYQTACNTGCEAPIISGVKSSLVESCKHGVFVKFHVVLAEVVVIHHR